MTHGPSCFIKAKNAFSIIQDSRRAIGASILVQPDILNIPYGDRHRIIDAARGKKDLADLASGNPEMPVSSFIIERLKTSLDSATMRYTNYDGLPELRQKIAERLKTDCQLVVVPETDVE